MESQTRKNLDLIAQTIFDKKGFNILALDVRGISTMTDYFIIAEGSVDRHVKAISHSVIEELKAVGERPLNLEGDQSSDWIVVDYGDIVIHLLIPEQREKYNLESLWKEGKIVEVKINIEKPSESR